MELSLLKKKFSVNYEKYFMYRKFNWEIVKEILLVGKFAEDVFTDDIYSVSYSFIHSIKSQIKT